METLDGFWLDAEHSGKIQKEKSIIKTSVDSYKKLETLIEEFDILCEYASEGDEDSLKEAFEIFDKCEGSLAEAEKQALLSEEMDANNAIIQINAGAGGTESCDWAAMLHRMFTRWCESKGFKIQVLDHQYGESAGIKSVTMTVEGSFAFGLLKSETGIHRLVRISPFDSAARRHTSFASVYITPELDDEVEIEVEDKDIRIDVYRSGGAGGQSVNTTDSAVRITHAPSGIVVTCQNERSQLHNKVTAMKVLKSRLYEKAMAEKQAEQDKINSEKKEIGWGSQIRSYVLHPYKLVKDHRTNCESGNAEKVLDGDLDNFMKTYLQWRSVGGEEK
ncbi:MAG: peptide chain release factor 2 [Thermoproteota archaeon]|jgi:peptide chain release factor 2